MRVRATRGPLEDTLILEFLHREGDKEWRSSETWTWADLESLGWDGTQEGFRTWAAQRLAERRTGADFQEVFGPRVRVLPDGVTVEETP